MRMTGGWMRTGVVAAMMVAAASAGAQTAAEDAVKAADAQAQVAAQQADAQARAAEIQAQMLPMQAKLAAEMVPMQVSIQAKMAPMMAKMEVALVPMQAAMLARSAVMQAEVMSVGDPQVKDELFAGTEKFAAGASDVTDVNLGPDMLGMVSGKHGGDLAHKLNFMVVRTYEYPHAGMYRMEDVDSYRQKLRSGWNCFIHTYESKSGESTDICSRALPNGQGNEMVILTVEPKELTFIHMSGNASLADLGKLGKLGNLGGNIPEPPAPPAAPSAPHP